MGCESYSVHGGRCWEMLGVCSGRGKGGSVSAKGSRLLLKTLTVSADISACAFCTSQLAWRFPSNRESACLFIARDCVTVRGCNGRVEV